MSSLSISLLNSQVKKMQLVANYGHVSTMSELEQSHLSQEQREDRCLASVELWRQTWERDGDVYQFKNIHTAGVTKRLSQSKIQISPDCDGKVLIVIDNFMKAEEENDLRNMMKRAVLDNVIVTHIGSSMKTAFAQDFSRLQKRRLLSNPPMAFNQLYKLFGWMSGKLGVVVTSHDFAIGDKCTMNFNFIREMTQESAMHGWHTDYNPLDRKKLSRSLPKSDKQFENGSVGNPLLLSVICYVAEKNFNPNWGMGTLFRGSKEVVVQCQQMRICIFEGDIVHSLESSRIPWEETTWRVSTVFRLYFHPSRDDISLREKVKELFQDFQHWIEASTFLGLMLNEYCISVIQQYLIKECSETITSHGGAVGVLPSLDEIVEIDTTIPSQTIARINYPNNCYYIGEVDQDGNRQGKGTLMYRTPSSQREYCEGEWKRGLRHGKIEYQIGEEFWQGEYRYNQKNGFGVLTTNFNTYRGNWRNDLQHGEGELTMTPSPNLRAYKCKGEWVDGELQGRATVTFDNGDALTGEVLDGKIRGQSVMKYANGFVLRIHWPSQRKCSALG